MQGVRSPDDVRALLRAELLQVLDPTLDRSLAVNRHDGRPAVVLVVGVNGTGKTTTVGKLARVLVAEDKDVLLAAADTFRAAAADQLQTWGERVGVPTVRSDRDGADPAAVAFQAVKDGIEQEVDVVLVDTAGRLQNKVGLMDELGKVKRVIEKQSPVDEVLLVLDATTGQNGLQQAKVFSDVVDVTGIVLTKLDGTAKGGIVVAVQRALGVPVKLVGLGEGPDDLAPSSRRRSSTRSSAESPSETVGEGRRGESGMGEAFLVGGVRTPVGRYGGALAGVRPDDLAALVVREAVSRAGVPDDAVDEVVLGAANQAGEDNRNVARMAVAAGRPARRGAGLRRSTGCAPAACRP